MGWKKCLSCLRRNSGSAASPGRRPAPAAAEPRCRENADQELLREELRRRLELPNAFEDGRPRERDSAEEDSDSEEAALRSRETSL